MAPFEPTRETADEFIAAVSVLIADYVDALQAAIDGDSAYARDLMNRLIRSPWSRAWPMFTVPMTAALVAKLSAATGQPYGLILAELREVGAQTTDKFDEIVGGIVAGEQDRGV